MRKKYMFFLVLLVMIIWASYPFWFSCFLAIFEKKDYVNSLGTAGDAFGGLNTLFSGLAFAGIIVSIALQSKELRDTRREMEEQKEQFVIQNESLKLQVFENTFFQLLQLHNEILNTISVEDVFNVGSSKKVLTGREAIGVLFDMFIKRRHRTFHPQYKQAKNLSDEYILFNHVYHETIGHYFRNIYQILKFVDQSLIPNKKFYTNLLRSQLSSNELGLLFYNCLSELGCERFKPLIERYEFLKHLPRYEIISPDEIKQYSPMAFGGNPIWSLLSLD